MNPKTNTDLSEDEFIAKCLSDMMHGWVPLKTYLRMYPDETKRAVESRVARKIWQWRVHYFCPKGSLAWVNLPAIHLWVSGLDSPDDNEREPVEEVKVRPGSEAGHMAHCYQGEYPNTCKYGAVDCPAAPNKRH